MLKKALVLGATLAVAMSASAGTYGCPACDTGPKLMDGFYMGVGFGRDVANDYVGAVNTPNADTIDLGLEGVEGSLFGGYGMSWDQFFAAVEVHGTISSKDSHIAATGAGSLTRVRMRWNWGVDLIPGYKITDAIMAYGRVGYTGGDHRVNFAAGTVPGGKRSKYLNGLRFGGGIQVAVADNVSMRMDYAHTRFDRHNITLTTPAATASFRPNTDQAEVGMSYHFG